MTKSPKRRVSAVIFLTLLLILCSIGNGHAKNAELNKDMAKIGVAMGILLPLVVNGDAIGDKKNRAIVKQKLSVIQKALIDAKPHFQKKSVTYQVSFKVITQHINKLIQVYEQGHYFHAKSMLKSTSSICASCHTQDSKKRQLFAGVTRNSFANDYEFAEFNFITRNYYVALQYYAAYFDSLDTHQQERYQLNALRNILTIYTQIYKSPKKAVHYFQRLLKNKKWSTYARKIIKDWISGLEIIVRDKGKDTPLTFASIQADVNKYLLVNNRGLSNIEYHIWLNGRLYRYLSTSAKQNQIPALLYWLAIANTLTNTNFYYSLSDLYLKQCMLMYTSSPYAKKCFKEYQENIVQSFSGSRGTDIPETIQMELDEFQQLLFGSNEAL